MIELPNKKKCYNLPEQVAQNLLNIQYLAEVYKDIDELPAIWQSYKETFDAEQETFGGWTTTFEGWDTTLSTYLANMSSAAVGAIAGQNIAPANVSATGAVSAPTITGGSISGSSIVETMTGYTLIKVTHASYTFEYVYAGIVKNGNKLTCVLAINITRKDDATGALNLGTFNIPSAVGDRLFPANVGGYNYLSNQFIYGWSNAWTKTGLTSYMLKNSATQLGIYLDANAHGAFTLNTKYYVRFEVTFLLSDNLAA